MRHCKEHLLSETALVVEVLIPNSWAQQMWDDTDISVLPLPSRSRCWGPCRLASPRRRNQYCRVWIILLGTAWFIYTYIPVLEQSGSILQQSQPNTNVWFPRFPTILLLPQLRLQGPLPLPGTFHNETTTTTSAWLPTTEHLLFHGYVYTAARAARGSTGSHSCTSRALFSLLKIEARTP